MRRYQHPRVRPARMEGAPALENTAEANRLGGEDASPSRILEIGYAFWRSKALLSAVELEVFTIHAEGPQHLGSLVGRVGIHERVRATSSMHSSRSACCIATERIDTATRPSAIAILIGASRPIPANC